MFETITLYRPVGQQELDLIAASKYRLFPPRLPEQPIFYPVLSEAYATQIARSWNARLNDPPVGYVTRFEVRSDYLRRYDVQVVGGSEHSEYWIPAEELDEFNRNIVGVIEVIAEYRGSYRFELRESRRKNSAAAMKADLVCHLDISIMFLFTFRSRIKPNSQAARDYSDVAGAYVNCWINFKDYEAAEKLARILIGEQGWIPENKTSESRVKRKSLTRKKQKQYYSEAIKYGYSLVFHMWVKDAFDANEDYEMEEKKKRTGKASNKRRTRVRS